MNNIHIGTSGWSYKHWHNLFYPPDVKPANWFPYYATHFHTVELNSSFYHLPTLQTVEGWAQKAPEGFLFCPKMNRTLTQYKKLREPEEPLERFFEVFKPLQGKMGPVLIQLPPSGSFNYEVAAHFFTAPKCYRHMPKNLNTGSRKAIPSGPFLIMIYTAMLPKMQNN